MARRRASDWLFNVMISPRSRVEHGNLVPGKMMDLMVKQGWLDVGRGRMQCNRRHIVRMFDVLPRLCLTFRYGHKSRVESRRILIGIRHVHIRRR